MEAQKEVKTCMKVIEKLVQ